MNKYLLILLATAVWPACSSVSAGALELPKIDRRPAAATWPWHSKPVTAIPQYDPNSTNPLQMDLRGRDLRGLDLRDALAGLQHADFDDRTSWPAVEKRPAGFDPGKIMELGKNPGLGLRQLHQQGITGRGVGIAILDKPLLVEHQEYAERLRFYEEINIGRSRNADMHGGAVASIAVGKTVGVAPEADLYYIAKFNGDFGADGFTWNFEYPARGICRILEINEQLPAERKIRVISISVGWSPEQKGYEPITEAAEKAKAAGMLVICSSVERIHGFKFHGLGRAPLADPDDANSYEPGAWWARKFYEDGRPEERLLVPMDARTTASPTGADEYVHYCRGGWSWAIPYIAGMYALAVQAEPALTPERFWALALKTGHTIELHHHGKTYQFGPILNPVGLIETLRRGNFPAGNTTIDQATDYTTAGL